MDWLKRRRWVGVAGSIALGTGAAASVGCREPGSFSDSLEARLRAAVCNSLARGICRGAGEIGDPCMGHDQCLGAIAP